MWRFPLIIILIKILFICPISSSFENKDCLISQYSSDGYGHQLEGKMSCLMADYMHPRLRYIHIPFDQMQHTPDLIEKAENFSNIGDNSTHESILKQFNPNIHRKTVDPPWLRTIAFENNSCLSNTIYVMDNCWEMLYKPPYSMMIDQVRYRLRESYFKTSKPPTGFNASRINVVVHIRRGDARVRYLPVDYYKTAMDYLRHHFSLPPIFWIVTDDPRWPGHRKLKQNPVTHKTYRDVVLPRLADSLALFRSFHRMVMADAIILSRSSLSSAAALLSNASVLIASSKHNRTPREGWYQTKRFIRIP
mmetsp:Transcript_4686/g.4819  ORF Transcript_4686/g.4819 Transcript_4686/m.4819 type:complete len:306 (+) Transcript_4686:9-926(+)